MLIDELKQKPHYLYSRRINMALDLASAPKEGLQRSMHVAKLFGISQLEACALLAGDKPPEEDIDQRLSLALGVNRTWLQSGKGQPYDPEMFKKYPIIKLSEETPWDLSTLRFTGRSAEFTVGASPGSFVLEIDESNADKALLVGSTLLMDPTVAPHNGWYVLVYLPESSCVLLRQFTRHADKNQAVELLSPNLEVLSVWLKPEHKILAAVREFRIPMKQKLSQE